MHDWTANINIQAEKWDSYANLSYICLVLESFEIFDKEDKTFCVSN